MTLLYAQAQELTWGSLALDAEAGPDLPFRIETMADTSSLGNPVPLVEVVESMLTDGSLSVVTSYGNREVTFRVRISAPDGRALAQGEAAFMAEVMAEQPSPLVWTPPAGDAWPCVFDVVTVKFEGDYSDGWDLDETMRACLYYSLTFECLPWTRNLETSVIPALPAPVDPEEPPAPVLIDDASAATNWIVKVSPTSGSVWGSVTGPTVVSGAALRASGDLAPGDAIAWLALERTAPVSMAGTPYLVVDIAQPSTIGGPISVRFDAGTSADLIVDPVAIIPTATPGVRSYYFEAPASFNKMLVRSRIQRSSLRGRVRTIMLEVHNVARIASVPAVASDGFQIARTAVVGGTAPTQAAIRFATTLDGDPGTDQLMTRTAMVYTGANPAIPLRPVRHDSAFVSPSATAVSGATNDLSEPTVYLVPVARLVEANYTLLARLAFFDPVTIEWTARVVDAAGADIPGSDIVETGTMLLPNDAISWCIYELGSIPMPILADLDANSTLAVEITISATSGGADVELDEAWVLDTDNGAVTVLNILGSTSGPYKVELRSPQLNSPRPAVVGTWADHGSQDVSRFVDRMGTHLFKPGLLYMLTVADGKKYAACELEYFERFHTRPGPPLVATDAG